MTFTYDPSSPTDITRVRFHIADTVQAEAMYTDAEITFQIAETGSWQGAVIACLQNAQTRIELEPDFDADWLTVRRRKVDWEKLIRQKRVELGVTTISTSAKPVYRADSLQTEPPEW